jgi:hypothetical protein
VKKIINAVAKMTPVFLALAMFCSSPTDKDVKWRSSVDFPLTANKKFFLGAMMDTLFFDKIQVKRKIVSIDTTKIPHDTSFDTSMTIEKAYPRDSAGVKLPDTVAFGFVTKDTAMDTISEDTLADKYFTDAFGPIPLNGAPDDTLTVPLTGTYTAGTQIALPATAYTLQYVYHIELMDVAQNATVMVTNNSPAIFGTVTITAGTLGSQTISNLMPNTTGTMLFNARAKIIDSVITVSVAVTPSANVTFAAGNNLQVIFSLNGLTANKVVVQDNLLAKYVRTFTNEYDLTDTVNVNYIDIGTGFFNYVVTNNTGIEMQMSVIHRHLWTTDFCLHQTPELDSLSQLVGLTSVDSGNASNCDIAHRESFPAHTSVPYSRHNLSANRMFPEWNPVKKKSVTKVDYNVSVGTYGRRVTLNAGDSLNFIIRTPALSFKFKEMYGHCTERYFRTSDPKNIPVNLPWSKAATDSLRNHFVLQKVYAKVATVMQIPVSGERTQDSAFLDTMHVYFTISSTSNPALTVSDSEVFVHVTRDKVFTRFIDITNVVNSYPDSVQMKVAAAVPVGTCLKTINDLTDPKDPAYPKYVGRMIIHGIINVKLFAPLCWTVANTTIMDLGGTKMNMKDANNMLDPFTKMDSLNASLNIKVTNSTNVYLRLFALAVADSGTKADSLRLDALVDTLNPAYINTNQFTDLINNPTAGYINLLGNNGLLIPPRDSTYENIIALKDPQLGQLLNAKTLGLRWQVRFLPQPVGGKAPDAMSNTDWMKLNSWIHIDGINSIDKLFQ